MKKGIFLDLDGTLLNDDYVISKANKEAVKKAKEKGWKVYIATGKSFTAADKCAKELGLDTPLIINQGQAIIDPPFKVLKFITQDYGYSKKIFKSKILKSFIRNWTIEAVDKFWTLREDNNQTLKLIDDKEKRVIELKTKEQENELIASAIIGLYIDIPKLSDEETSSLIKKLSREFPTKEFQYWYTEHEFTTITVRPKITSKWIGIKELKHRDNLDFTATIGNGWSDREMLQNADLGVAMKNSLSSVQKFANRTSEFDNNNDGIAHEINKILEEHNG